MIQRHDLGELTGIQNEQAGEGEWVDPSPYIGCCDCGLVHEIDWRVKLPSGEVVIFPEGTSLELRTFRAPELTEQARKSQTFTCKLTSLEEEK